MSGQSVEVRRQGSELGVAPRRFQNLLTWLESGMVGEDEGTINKPLVSSDRAVLEARLAELDQFGALAERKAIATAVASMLALFSAGRVSKDEAAMLVSGYVSVLEKLPAWAVQKACGELSRGEVPGVSPDFPPTAARVHVIAVQHAKPYWVERRRISAVLGARVVARTEPTPEQIKRVGELVADFKDKISKVPDPIEALKRPRLDALEASRNAILAGREAAE
jgi:hypothetical protein